MLYYSGMKPSLTLKLTLILTFLTSLIGAYFLLFSPEIIEKIYPEPIVLDIVHTHLAMASGLFLIVFAAAAFLGLVNPIKNASAILLLILMHFAGFVTDIVLIAKGTVLPLRLLIPDMVYVLAICILLIRYYPSEPATVDISSTADQLVGAVKKQLKKEKIEQPKAPQQKTWGFLDKIKSKFSSKSK